jgi:hypothetical protein
MFESIHYKTATLPLPNSISGAPLRRGVLLIAFPLALAWFALSPRAQATCPSSCDSNNNTAEGDNALQNLTASGFGNTAIGFNTLLKNTDGHSNTAVGVSALELGTNGFDNTATGWRALASNLGNDNTGLGNRALGAETTDFQPLPNATGSFNTALGSLALLQNTTGNDNTAAGYQALFSNMSGPENTALGFDALYSNTTAADNTATGFQALFSNTTGNDNTATGWQALFSNKGGNNNTAVGFDALANNISGASNVALGYNAGLNLTKGNNNIIIGANVPGNSADANTIRIGKQGTQQKTFVGGIYNIAEPIASGIKPVYINSNGQLGTAAPGSSSRFKTNIKPMEKSSDAILALKPVTFQYRNDEEQTLQFGLIAEEVAKVNPDLVVRNDNGEIYTVRYEAVNAMLLNEFLKEHQRAVEDHRKVEEQGAIIARQQKQIEALTATVQKVSAQVEMSKPAPQVAADTH